MRRVNFMHLTFFPMQYCINQDAVGFFTVRNDPQISVAFHCSLFLTHTHATP